MTRKHGTIGRLVRLLRGLQRSENIKLVEQAERLGVSDSTLCMLYSGQRQPGPKVLHGVLTAYPNLRDEVRLFLLQDITSSEETNMFW